MRRPRRAAGTRLSRVVNSSGIMIAVPLACTMRPTSRMPKPGAMAAMSVPIENSVMAAPNTWRVEKRCRMKPVAGITTAIVSMKPVVSHCAVAVVMSRSAMRLGSATLMIVSLRITTKAATTSRPMTSGAPCGRRSSSGATARSDAARAAAGRVSSREVASRRVSAVGGVVMGCLRGVDGGAHATLRSGDDPDVRLGPCGSL